MQVNILSKSKFDSVILNWKGKCTTKNLPDVVVSGTVVDSVGVVLNMVDSVVTTGREKKHVLEYAM